MRAVKSIFRFNFFQRQFFGHMLIAILILALISGGLTYYSQKNNNEQLKKQLNSASNGIVNIILKTKSTESLISISAFLKEQNLTIVLLNQAGELQIKNVEAVTLSLRNKAFFNLLRAKISSLHNTPSFIIENNAAKPYMILARSIHAKAPLDEVLYLYVYSTIPGLPQVGKAVNQTILITFIAALFLALILSWIISRSMSQSVQKLRIASREIADGRLQARSTVKRSDELGDLSHDFNEMAERLEMSSAKLEQQDKQRLRFLTDVTHELRTPLTSIRGIIEGFKNQLVTDPAEQQKYWTIIEKETFRLIRLINELLDLEKIQAGELKLNLQTHNTLELLEVITESLEILIEEKNLKILIKCDSQIEIYGDYDRLTQILINLIKNSIQFTEYGTIRLTAEMNESQTIIEITDSGKGMTKQELAFIWDRFYKTDPSRAKEKSETGLGLSIVYQLVTAHQGSIHVQSELGIGTAFRIEFPRPIIPFPVPK